MLRTGKRREKKRREAEWSGESNYFTVAFPLPSPSLSLTAKPSTTTALQSGARVSVRVCAWVCPPILHSIDLEPSLLFRHSLSLPSPLYWHSLHYPSSSFSFSSPPPSFSNQLYVPFSSLHLTEQLGPSTVHQWISFLSSSPPHASHMPPGHCRTFSFLLRRLFLNRAATFRPNPLSLTLALSPMHAHRHTCWFYSYTWVLLKQAWHKIFQMQV